jgi:hypothetical protein
MTTGRVTWDTQACWPGILRRDQAASHFIIGNVGCPQNRPIGGLLGSLQLLSDTRRSLQRCAATLRRAQQRNHTLVSGFPDT